MSLSHQNVCLARGRHSSPGEGVCVVELASMLAGERFSDHPHAVCPVIASYARSVNDYMPVEDLPELYPFAAAIVGTRGKRAERRARAHECARWAANLGVDHTIVSVWLGHRWGWAGPEIGSVCARAALRRGGPGLALTLLEALLPKELAALEVERPIPDLEPTTGQAVG